MNLITKDSTFSLIHLIKRGSRPALNPEGRREGIPLFRLSRFRAGDTIVEVLVSVTVLALVLAGAYVSSSNSLRQGTAAGNRNQALGHAQAQIGLIKSAAGTNAATLNSYKINQPFCIASDGTVDTSSINQAEGVCYLSSWTPYGVGVKYSSSNQVFTVTAKWPGGGATAQDQLVLYYKAGSN
ncbi:MAG: hypothetical protein WD877_01080 [Candidatus Saccharimonadales bacterium]